MFVFGKSIPATEDCSELFEACISRTDVFAEFETELDPLELIFFRLIILYFSQPNPSLDEAPILEYVNNSPLLTRPMLAQDLRTLFLKMQFNTRMRTEIVKVLGQM